MEAAQQGLSRYNPDVYSSDPQHQGALSNALIAFLLLNVALCCHLALQILVAMTQLVATPVLEWQRRRGMPPNPWLLEALLVAEQFDEKLANVYNLADDMLRHAIRGAHWLYLLYAGPTFLEIFRLLALIVIELASMPGRWLFARDDDETDDGLSMYDDA